MIMEHFDLAFIALYVFWFFFAGLIYYIRREDRREGFPLEADKPGDFKYHGFLWIPEPKEFKLPHGGTRLAPDYKPDTREIAGRPFESWPGAPIEPTGEHPMLDCIGPSAYAERADEPDLTPHGDPKIVPLRVAQDFSVHRYDSDPRGFKVMGSDRELAGRVVDLWVDRMEALARYIEVEVPDPAASTAISSSASQAGSSSTVQPTRRVLFPMTLADVNGRRRRVDVTCVLAHQFQLAPATRSSDQVTLLEEEKIQAFFASGYLFSRQRNREPFL
ncbi:MAG: photosynthetic reaction center subunit H [Pseudomonadota bacterium]